VLNYRDDSVTPINLASKTAGAAIAVGHGPVAIAIKPDGTTVYVVNYFDNSVTPINVATGSTASAIELGSNPIAMAAGL
jgi:YVTN family beta-propeller protein